MTEETARSSRKRTLAWGLFALAVVVLAVAIVVTGVLVARGRIPWHDVSGTLSFLPAGLAFVIVGLIVSLRRPSNAVGWLMLVIGDLWCALVLPLGDASSPLFFGNAPWVLPLGLMGTHLLLRLPEGSLPSPRWRWVSRASTLAIVSASALIPPVDSNDVSRGSAAQNLAGTIAFLLLVACLLASVASLFVRVRRADADERHQLRWIALGGVTFIGVYLVGFVPGLLGAPESGVLQQTAERLVGVAYAAVPVCIGVAILRYRLYAIDVVIRKAVVLGALAAFFTAVYVAVVVGIGALVGSRSTPALSFLAAAVVAAGFQPALTRARRFGDRVVYGKRSTPYEVLAELGERLGDTYAADDVLPRIARVLGQGVGATRARVWLAVARELRPVATWPTGAGDEPVDDFRVDVRHQGEQLGALSVAMPANDPMDPTKERLVSDLAAQAGLVLRNVRLTEELRARIEDLQAAQKRLVVAQDDERRRLERNIHDGAQQQLVALAVKLRLADGLLDKDPARVHAMLVELGADTNAALQDLRDLARGIYPPLLADRGLAMALEGQARKASVPVEIRADGIGRYPQEVEAAAYFSCLEALQNVTKYARATRAVVTLSDGDGQLRFEVADDGAGFDPQRVGYGTGLQGIADRLGSLAGTLSVTSSAGNGTKVVGVIPAVPV